MKTKIAAATASILYQPSSSIELAIEAGRSCLKQANLDPQEIDLMINVGIYRDKNYLEPSICALIQKELHINPDFVKYPVQSPAFSFDVMNGGCGFVNALQVANSLVKSRSIQNALIVASDMHPSQKANHEDFPFSSIGTAVILTKNEEPSEGLSCFHYRTKSETIGRHGFIDFSQNHVPASKRIEIEQSESFSQDLADFVSEQLKQFVNEQNIDLSKTLILCSHPSREFLDALHRETEINLELSHEVLAKYGDSHTSSLALAFVEAQTKSIFPNYEKLLFIGADCGLTSAFALYDLN